jgi:hypothetical protein
MEHKNKQNKKVNISIFIVKEAKVQKENSLTIKHVKSMNIQ